MGKFLKMFMPLVFLVLLQAYAFFTYPLPGGLPVVIISTIALIAVAALFREEIVRNPKLTATIGLMLLVTTLTLVSLQNLTIQAILGTIVFFLIDEVYGGIGK